ncbi:TonB-dependent receptor [Saccharobesus litoralis]|uniref:TonB-dependent receptor n=1 Tax=Saccharobesus litoralis TaxID=2172099 RepID=A0A2S0VV54_9ALTE|nr:TonB-dependent receptor [Saccharobesus litoralis]AWB68063.1 TonB-dependent receptor [Saccharobesus litoralis]
MKQLKLTPITLAVNAALLTGLAYTAPALAAEQTAEEEIEVIAVKGIRASAKANLNTKRFADSIVDAITAEDIGKFPDKNVAESLQRVAGVSITRDFGEGEKVSIRGTAPQLNNTLLNGQAVATTKWWALEPSSRSFNFSLLPSELVSALEVYKSPEAKIDEGAIGGTVILRTRKPLDLDSGTIYGSAGVRYNDKTESSDPQFSGLFSWKNEDETFGILASIIQQGREQRRDGLEAFGWFDATRADTAASVGKSIPGWDYDTNTGKTASWNWGMGSAYFDQERDRLGLNLTAQMRPSDNLDLTLNIVDSELKQTNTNNNYISSHGWAAYMPCTPWDPASDFELCAGIEDYTLTDPSGVAALTKYTIGKNGHGDYQLNQMNESLARVSTLTTQVIDLEANYTGDNYTIHAQVGVTEANGGYDREDLVNFGHASGSNIEIYDNGLINFSFPTELGGLPTDSYAGFDFRQYRWNSRPEVDKETYAQADFKYELDGDVISSIEVGVKFRDKEHSQSGVTTETQDYSALIDNADTSKYDGAMSPDLHSSVANAGTLTRYATIDIDKIRADADKVSGITPTIDYGNVYQLTEDITAAYVQANLDMGELKGNVGVRLVNTEVTSAAYELSDNTWFSESSSYSDVLPSLNLSYSLSDDLIIRGAASKTMSRANYADLAATRTLSANLTGSGGNTELKPYDATNFDLSVEWYFSDEGLLSLALFNKQIDSFIFNSAEQATLSYDCDQSGSIEPGETCIFTMTRPNNGAEAKNTGIEVSFQMPIGEYFGVVANYTYSDAEGKNAAGDTIDLAGNSKNTVNLTGYFENDNISARVAYNQRSSYLTGFTFGGANTADAYSQLDASVSYNLTDNWSVTLEGQNLTDSEVFHYQGQKYRPIGLYTFGRSYYVSTSFNF